jgi:pimeloyl-ACP methyl ester carboxylesterase
MEFKLRSGLSIAASSWGSESDPLVILMHGGGQTRHAWGNTGEVLGLSGFHVLAIDLRGHGDSDWHPDGDYSIDAYKSDLVSILNQLGKSASIVGASLGGMVAFSLAGDLDNGELVNALVMVDIGLYPNEKGSDQIINFMQSGNKGFASLEEASEAISGYLPHRKKPKDKFNFGQYFLCSIIFLNYVIV